MEVIKSWCSSLPVGAGAYAFENVRTSVEHGCRHVGWQTFGGIVETSWSDLLDMDDSAIFMCITWRLNQRLIARNFT